MPLSKITFLTLSLVTTVGTNSADGVLNSVASGLGVWPLSNWTATSAAFSATILMGLEMVLYWSPLMIRWIAAISASLPVTGGMGDTPAAFRAAIEPPAVPSLAATMPVILSPNWVIWPATQSWAFDGCHSGVS